MLRPIFGSMATNIEENESVSNISVYPNPARDILNIAGTNGDCTVTIFAPTGQILILENNERINVSHLQSGVYIIKIENGGQSALLKFVKQ